MAVSIGFEDFGLENVRFSFQLTLLLEMISEERKGGEYTCSQ